MNALPDCRKRIFNELVLFDWALLRQNYLLFSLVSVSIFGKRHFFVLFCFIINVFYYYFLIGPIEV